MRLVDLSYDIYAGMFKFHGDYHPQVEVEITGTYGRNRCEVRRLVLGTHAGTHVDAPRHFVDGGETIEALPLEIFFTRTRVVDAWTDREDGVLGPDLFPAVAFAPAGGAGAPTGLLLRTGWEKRWGDPSFYRGFPTLGEGVAESLLRAGCRHLAVDFPLTVAVHEAVLGAGGILIENLCNVAELKESEPLLSALPLKVRAGDGAPARVIVIEGWPERTTENDA